MLWKCCCTTAGARTVWVTVLASWCGCVAAVWFLLFFVFFFLVAVVVVVVGCCCGGGWGCGTTFGALDDPASAHNSHRHSSLSPRLFPMLFNVFMCCEKKRSPLSGSNGSAFGNGIEHPTDWANLFTYPNSVWLKCGSTFSQPAGMTFRSTIDFVGFADAAAVFAEAVFSVVTWVLLCRIVRLNRAAPAKLRLSARLSRMPQLAKWANRSWNDSSFDSPLLDKNSVSWCFEFGLGGISSHIWFNGNGSAR